MYFEMKFQLQISPVLYKTKWYVSIIDTPNTNYEWLSLFVSLYW